MALRTAGHHHIGTSAPSEDPVDVGHLWTDTTAALLKRCTSTSPYTWVSTESGLGGGAPSDAQYIVLATDATLTQERVLTVSNGIQGSDGGAGGAYTIQPTYGTTANTVCQGNDSRLSDSRTPTAHATSHQSGGSDPIKLDDLATPDDNTDLDATTGRHGLLPKLGGGTSNFLRADGSWAAPTASVTWTEAEIDFGSGAPQSDAVFTITDATVSTSSKIIVVPSGKAATGRTADDWQWDGIVLAANPGTGSFSLYASVVGGGSVKGPRKIQYSVAS